MWRLLRMVQKIAWIPTGSGLAYCRMKPTRGSAVRCDTLLSLLEPELPLWNDARLISRGSVSGEVEVFPRESRSGGRKDLKLQTAIVLRFDVNAPGFWMLFSYCGDAAALPLYWSSFVGSPIVCCRTVRRGSCFKSLLKDVVAVCHRFCRGKVHSTELAIKAHSIKCYLLLT